jgi:DNA-binding beta-propeller fold protein YncE
MPRTPFLSSSSKWLGVVCLLAGISFFIGHGRLGLTSHFSSVSTPHEIGTLLSVEPLPEVGGEMCQWMPASASGPWMALQATQGSPSGPAHPDEASREEVAERPPLRMIRDPYPSFSGVAVDTVRDEVYAADENLLQILVYDRTANTPAAATMTEPRRTLGGPNSKIEFVCGLYFDEDAGEIYASHGDSTQMLVFSHTQDGDVPPVRELRTPKSRVIAVDEKNQELFITSQHDSAVVVWEQGAAEREAPIRLLQGNRTQLANPHGIAVDNDDNLIYVTNHGQKAERDSALRDGDRAVPNWPLERNQAVPGTGTFQGPSITVYTRTASGDTPPLRVIKGPKTQLNWPAGIVLDKKRGELLVANDVDHSILVFRAADQGDVAPIRVLKGPKTALQYPSSLFLDAKNDELWVSNYGNHSLTVYSPTADGDTPPRRMIRSGPLGNEALMIGNPGAVSYDTRREEILVPN